MDVDHTPITSTLQTALLILVPFLFDYFLIFLFCVKTTGGALPESAPEPDPHVHAGRLLLLLAPAQHHQPCRGSRYEPCVEKVGIEEVYTESTGKVIFVLSLAYVMRSILSSAKDLSH
jgi:hypothetical protein